MESNGYLWGKKQEQIIDLCKKRSAKVRKKLKFVNLNRLRLSVYRSSKNISAVCGLATYSKKKLFAGASSIENLVNP